jgi:hypothetical protein
MPNFYTRQPDGKYAVYSTNIDDFIKTDATRNDIIEWEIEESIKEIKQDLNETFDVLDAGINEGYHCKVRKPRNIWAWSDLQKHIAEREESAAKEYSEEKSEGVKEGS